MRHRYQTRSGLIALLHRLGMEHRKPKVVSRKLDPAKQAAFIEAYEHCVLDAVFGHHVDHIDRTHLVLAPGARDSLLQTARAAPADCR